MPDAPRAARRPTLAALERRDEFASRHIGPDDADQRAILDTLGFPSRGAMIDAIVPAAIRNRAPLALPGPVPEHEALARLRAIPSNNRVMTSFIGQGYYGTFTPGVILRNVLENHAWYTAYTPYQPEISQGRLEALVNYQTMVCDLTAMAITNASVNSMGGQVAPGLSAGKLTLVGDYVQGANGAYTVELGGLTPETQYHVLAITNPGFGTGGRGARRHAERLAHQRVQSGESAIPSRS